MNISLTPELEQLVTKKVQSGMYNSASEVIREGLRLIKEQDDIKEYRLSHLRREIDVGGEQIAQGQYTDYDTSDLQPFVEEIKAAGRKRLAEHNKGMGK